MLRTLRQPRYAALTALMIVIAIVCVLAGTWQISRFEQKKSENDALRTNDHRPAAAVQDLLPLTGSGKRAPSTDAIEFRTVRLQGTYDDAHQGLVRNRTLSADDDTVGYLVVTPLDTSAGTVLVVRGFLKAGAQTDPTPPPAPSGPQTVTARLMTAESRDDRAADLPSPQLESINPAQQAARLGRPVFEGYAEVMGGTAPAGLEAIPAPDLSNPAGGALEPQHFAYVIQWYLFALLALAAPVAMARSEAKAARAAAAPAGEFDDEPVVLTEDEARAAKLAARYGRVR
ncbi:MAG: SURF1 family protein [Jatrophihabitans sp.]|uniref:SURF1 family protein n=1 Tax=Jatrophihabitans sp. TaxID=1932789 RepID=UPI003F80FE12